MSDTATPLIPVRMVNEYVYCLRLAYMMWVQGELPDMPLCWKGILE